MHFCFVSSFLLLELENLNVAGCVVCAQPSSAFHTHTHALYMYRIIYVSYELYQLFIFDHRFVMRFCYFLFNYISIGQHFLCVLFFIFLFFLSFSNAKTFLCLSFDIWKILTYISVMVKRKSTL